LFHPKAMSDLELSVDLSNRIRSLFELIEQEFITLNPDASHSAVE